MNDRQEKRGAGLWMGLLARLAGPAGRGGSRTVVNALPEHDWVFTLRSSTPQAISTLWDATATDTRASTYNQCASNCHYTGQFWARSAPPQQQEERNRNSPLTRSPEEWWELRLGPLELQRRGGVERLLWDSSFLLLLICLLLLKPWETRKQWCYQI